MLYRKTRVLTITPSKKWKDADSLLGALVRYEEYATAHERVLRIAKVHPNSPTMLAGLQPETDYILGTPQYLYTDLNELAKFIEMTQEKETIKSLEIYIYSSQTNTVRSTLLMPNKNWGGQGYLGCEFALGILNQLPHLEDSMHVSNLGEVWNGASNGQIDRLDDDDDTNDESHHCTDSHHHHHHHHHHGDKKAEEQSQHDETPKAEQDQEVKEVIPEFKLRPPTDTEINRTHPPFANGEDSHTPKNDLSQELTNQRMKLLHISNHHKSHPKTATKATIKPLRSTSNPFNTSSENEATQNSHSEAPETGTGNISGTGNGSLSQIPETTNAASVLEPSSKEQILRNQADHENTQEVPASVEEKNGEVSTTAEEVPVKMPVKVPVGIQEKQVCKTTIEYNFFSKKLNGDYKILSSNLFSIDQLGQLNS